jgi:hypothetical protein
MSQKEILQDNQLSKQRLNLLIKKLTPSSLWGSWLFILQALVILLVYTLLLDGIANRKINLFPLDKQVQMDILVCLCTFIIAFTSAYSPLDELWDWYQAKQKIDIVRMVKEREREFYARLNGSVTTLLTEKYSNNV